MAKNKKVIVLGGPGGSGRTTTAEQIVKITGFRRIYGGGIQRQIAMDVGYCNIDSYSGKKKFSEEKFVQYFKEYVPNHPEIDFRIEVKLFEEAHKEDVLIESMTFAPITKRLNLPYVRVWITADERERAKRICEREAKFGNEITVDDMIALTKKRNEQDKERWFSEYGFYFDEVEKYYDLVFDTTDVPQEKMGEVLLAKIREAGFEI